MPDKRITIVPFISVALILLFVSLAAAQIDVGNFTITGAGELDGLPRGFSGDKTKFEEYRDVPETVVVPEIELKAESKNNDFYIDGGALKVGRADQEYRLRMGKYGLLDMEFEWDQIPHRFNIDNALTPYTSQGGNFTLGSKPGLAGNCPNDGTVEGWVNTCSQPIDLSLIQGFARFKLRYTPSPRWTFSARYVLQKSNGDRAFGTVTNGFTNIAELAEPIDYQTNNFELGGEYAGNWWTLALKYNASFFHNSNSTLVWDNAFNTSGLGPACVDAVNSTCRGRLDLYPSNQAHTFTLTGTAKLPFKTTFLGTSSYGWQLQNDPFLPFTINSALAPFNSINSLNRRNLDGDVRPTMINATLVNRYFERLDLKAFYRFYDLANRSKSLFLDQGYIRTDTGSAPIPPGTVAAAEELRSYAYAYSKQNIGFDAGYNFTRWLKAKFTYGWERMHRDRREVLNSNENSFGPTFDITPNSWLLFRASYRRYLRDAHDYDAGRQVVIETGLTPQEIEEDRLEALRKFDEAARNRDKINLFTQISPIETLTLHAGFDFTNDVYPRTVMGLKTDVNYSPSVGFIYAPLDWVNLFGDYNWERYYWKMKAMERNNAAQTPASNPDRIWTSRGTDTINTFSLGSDLKLIENILGLRVQYSYSYAQSLVHASGSTCAGCTQAVNYPSLTNSWQELFARFTYAVHKNVDLKFGYYFNRYTSKDYGVDIMRPWMGNVDPGAANSIFLGDHGKGSYTAHVGFVGVRLKF
jgi:MtrB/PioB family decaheme-associated outer membrane protein